MNERKVEKDLSESGELYRKIVWNHPEATVMSDLKGQIIHVSQRALELHGVERAEELIGKNMFDLIIPEDHEKMTKTFEKTLKQEAARNVECSVLRNDGTHFVGEFNVTLIKDSRKTPTAFLLTVRDSTQRKLARKELEESEKQYRNFFENAPIGIYRTTPGGRILMANPALVHMLGYSSLEELSQRNLEEEGYETGYPRSVFKERIEREGQIIGLESAWTRKDGTTVFIRENAKAIRDDSGTIKYYEGTAENITERKEAEGALEESEEKYRTLTDNLNVGVYRNTVGPKGRFIEANPAIIKMFGYKTREEFFALNVAELYQNPEDREEFNEKMLKDGFVRDEELQLKKKDGTPFIGSVSAVAVKDEKGATKYYDGIVEDITEHKLADEALQRSEEKYRTILKSIEDGYFEVDIRGNLTFFNDSLCTILGYSRDELLGMNNRVYMDKETAHRVYTIFNEVYTTGIPPTAVGWEVTRKDGTKRFVEASISLIVDSTGEPTGFRGILRDITERKRTELQLKSLFDASRLINSTMDMDETFEFISDSVHELIGFDNFIIFLVSEDKKSVFPAYASEGIRKKVESVVLAYGEGIVGKCIENKEICLSEDAQKDERARKIFGITEVFRSQIVLPLIIEGEGVGAIHISKSVKKAFSQADVEALRPLSEVISSAIRNSQLLNEIKELNQELEERIKERSQRIEILLNTRQRLQAERSWEKGLVTIVESMSSLGLDRVGIFLVDPLGTRLNYHFGKGAALPESSTSISLKRKEYFGVQCILEKRTIFVEDSTSIEGRQIAEADSFVWVPIVVQDEAFAALAASNPRSERPITEKDVKDLEILASMCGAFIDRTRILIEPVAERGLRTEIKHWLDPMEGYLVLEKKPERSFKIFIDLVNHGIPGFVVSRLHPEKLRRTYKLVKTPVLWLSRTEVKDTLNPNDLSKLGYIVENFTRTSENSVILLEGLEYLITQLTFEPVVKHLQELKDTVILNNSRLIVPLDSRTLSPREFNILKREFTVMG